MTETTAAVLLKAEDAAPSVWLLEWERLRSLRSVSVVVDTSDSCWDGGAHPPTALRDMFNAIATVLNKGDRCRLWMLGMREPVQTFVLNGETRDQRDGLRDGVLRVLRMVRGGSWMRDTWDRVQYWSARDAHEGLHPFILFATDGELFDAEAITGGSHAPVGVVRTGAWAGTSADRADAGAITAAGRAMLELQARLVSPTGDSVGEFLTLSQAAPDLRMPASDSARVTAYSSTGELRSGPAPTSVHDYFLGLAFVGESEPQVRISAGSDAGAAAIPVRPGRPQALSERQRRVVEALRRRTIAWDEKRLAALAQAIATQRWDDPLEPCPSCSGHFPRAEDMKDSVYCRRCNSLLLSRNRVVLGDLVLPPGGWLYFAVDASGQVSSEPVEHPAVDRPPVGCVGLVQRDSFRLLAVSLRPRLMG